MHHGHADSNSNPSAVIYHHAKFPLPQLRRDHLCFVDTQGAPEVSMCRKSRLPDGSHWCQASVVVARRNPVCYPWTPGRLLQNSSRRGDPASFTPAFLTPAVSCWCPRLVPDLPGLVPLSQLYLRTGREPSECTFTFSERDNKGGKQRPAVPDCSPAGLFNQTSHSSVMLFIWASNCLFGSRVKRPWVGDLSMRCYFQPRRFKASWREKVQNVLSVTYRLHFFRRFHRPSASFLPSYDHINLCRDGPSE